MTELIKKGSAAKEAAQFLAQASTKQKNAALLNLSNDLLTHTASFLKKTTKILYVLGKKVHLKQ